VVLIYFTAPHSLGVSSAFSKHVRQRYEHHFGRPNQHLAVGNHSLVLLDAPGIVDEDYMRAGHGTSFEEWIPLRDGPIEFIKGLAAGTRVVQKTKTADNGTQRNSQGPPSCSATSRCTAQSRSSAAPYESVGRSTAA
jgi:hypothetical protein